MSGETADVIRLRETNRALEEAVVQRTEALMNAKRTWEATFDAIVDPLAIVGPDLRIVRTNVGHAQHAQTDVRDVNGKHCYDVLFARSEACVGCAARQTFATGIASSAEVGNPARGRTYRMWAFPKVAPGEPYPEQVVCHYKDITEEKDLQRRLLQSDKMAAVGTLAGGVAHEVNNPLGAILAFTQLALRQAKEGTTLHEFLAEIEDSAQRCKRIVASLLDFSRPSAGVRRPVDLEAVVEQALFLAQTQYDRAQYLVVRDYQPDVPAVLGDRNQLSQVLLNLITNAYQSLGREEATLTLGLHAVPDERVEIVVQDTGDGIEERYLTKVFEPFFTTKPEGEGTGLGLSISYRIVKDHGGDIQVESKAGAGTRFVISFPWPQSGGK